MRRAAVLVAAAALAGGCGGGSHYHGPKVPHDVAQRLLGELDTPSALQAETIRDINAHRIPSELQEPLLSKVNAFVAQPTKDRRDALKHWLSERAA